jgi:hypothetical protein
MPDQPASPDIAMNMAYFMEKQVATTPRYRWNCHTAVRHHL